MNNNQPPQQQQRQQKHTTAPMKLNAYTRQQVEHSIEFAWFVRIIHHLVRCLTSLTVYFRLDFYWGNFSVILIVLPNCIRLRIHTHTPKMNGRKIVEFNRYKMINTTFVCNVFLQQHKGTSDIQMSQMRVLRVYNMDVVDFGEEFLGINNGSGLGETIFLLATRDLIHYKLEWKASASIKHHNRDERTRQKIIAA